MAEYGTYQGRNNTESGIYGTAYSNQRDEAFSSIFGAAPPPGRSQTMNLQPAFNSRTGGTHTISALSTQFPGRVVNGSADRQAQLGQAQNPQAGTDTYQIPNGSPAPPVKHQPQPQYLPQPVYPDRRPYPPQRVDPRGPPSSHTLNKAVSNGGHPTGSAAALNSNPYRTQSLANDTRPPVFQTSSGSYNIPPAHVFRQQPYLHGVAKTTAQGRIVPERHDERTMSMTSFAKDNEYNQTMSGRVIPSRRRETTFTADISKSDFRPSVDSHDSSQTLTNSMSSIGRDTQGMRALSMASTLAPSERSSSMTQPRLAISKVNSHSAQNNMAPRKRVPLVYPALLSKVAKIFREEITIADREKDGLVYKSAFSGSEAVDVIAHIMQTSDRNLALLLGRSLDAQKLFHDVTYDHRLRDSPNELYQFRESLMEDDSEVNGVFTLTLECYSPTCTPDRLCYSIACPKRVDQQKRLNMKPQSGLKRSESRTSLHEDQSDEQKLWINTVSKEVADSVNEKEKKRQEVISEIMYTERDFVKDLEYLRDFWINPLRSLNPTKSSPIPEHRREKFVRTVFGNCQEVLAVNSRMADALTQRQRQSPVVRNVGDVFLAFVPRFGPFIKYGANQLFGKYEFEKEKQANQMFARFVNETERLKESRKLELNGYLTKPTTRLARYPLLLENVLKYTADDNPDQQDIPKAIAEIRGVLSKVNVESGKSENMFTLLQLNQQLVWRPGEYVDLKLTEEGRQMLFKGMLKKSPTDTNGDIQAYLFDNSLLFVRAKFVNKREELKVYKRPIPLGLLVISHTEETNPKLNLTKRPSSSLIPGARSSAVGAPRQDQTKQQGYPIMFKHLGRGGFEHTLYCASQIQQEKWMKAVDTQQKTLKEHSNIFTQADLSQGFSLGSGMKINCCVPIDGGRKLVVGTDIGVYLTDRKHKDASARPKRVLDVRSVTQVDVLEQHQILLVLAEKNLYSYAIEALDPEESMMNPVKRGKKISGASFFKIGVFDGQHLVCCVKTTSLSATIKVFKPTENMTSNKKKSGFSKMLAGGQEALRPHKEFYIPTETYSIHFLRSSLCVGCARGFEIVTLDTLVTQPLLDQADTSLDFVALKENLKPIHVERINRDFLLCYSDFSFFVNRHGWRAFPEWKILWEGNPQAFAIFQPYILAFEPSFIEIRHMDTGVLVYILTAKNVRMLHSSTREILYAYEDDIGEDVIASLDFWGRPS